MSETTIQELFRNLERTVSERLKVIDELLRFQRVPAGYGGLSYSGPSYNGPSYSGPSASYSGPTASYNGPTASYSGPTASYSGPSASYSGPSYNRPDPLYVKLNERISSLEQEVTNLRAELDSSRGPLIPQYPLNGIEVIPKKEVTITEPEPISLADRLLLNPSALKALEKEEHDDNIEMEMKFDEQQEQPEEEQPEEEQPEENEEEQPEENEENGEDGEDGEELEEFEYKGSTYYRDSDKNVFTADEEGELVATPIGVWSEVKKRIILKKE